MSQYPDISIVIPVFNEGESVVATVAAVRAATARLGVGAQLVVVNDGSTDDTGAHLSGLKGVDVVEHPRNLGYGAALKSGIRAARNEWLVITDADLTYPIDELDRLLAGVPKFDMVVGARQGAFYFGSPVKRVLRLLFKFLVEFATGNEIPDINSGFRVFRRSIILRCFPLLSSGFSFTTTSTLLFFLSQRRVQYVPISYHQRKGKSHVKLMRDGVRSFQIIVEAILATNPIKGLLLLALMYGGGVALLRPLLLLLPQTLALIVFLTWSFGCVIMAIGFLGVAVQLGERVRFGSDE